MIATVEADLKSSKKADQEEEEEGRKGPDDDDGESVEDKEWEDEGDGDGDGAEEVEEEMGMPPPDEEGQSSSDREFVEDVQLEEPVSTLLLCLSVLCHVADKSSSPSLFVSHPRLLSPLFHLLHLSLLPLLLYLSSTTRPYPHSIPLLSLLHLLPSLPDLLLALRHPSYPSHPSSYPIRGAFGCPLGSPAFKTRKGFVRIVRLSLECAQADMGTSYDPYR